MSHDQLLAWAAGFVDGEGTIGLAFGRSGQVVLYVSVAQNVDTPLRRLVELFGGAVHKYGGARRKNLQFQWRIFGRRAADAIHQLRPWLTVKDEHADLALKYWSRCGRAPGWNAKRDTGRALGLTAEERLIRLDFHARMRVLQHKGIHRRRPITDAEFPQGTKEKTA